MVKLLQLSSTPEDVNLKCPKFGRTSLHYLSKVENGHSKYISNVLGAILGSSNVDMYIKDKRNNKTAFRYICENGHTE